MRRPVLRLLSALIASGVLAACGGGGTAAVTAGSPPTASAPSGPPSPSSTADPAHLLSEATAATAHAGTAHFDARGDMVDPLTGKAGHQYVIGDFDLAASAWWGVRSKVDITGGATDEVDRVIGSTYWYRIGTDPNASGIWGRETGQGVNYDPVGSTTGRLPARSLGTESLPPPLLVVAAAHAERVSTDARDRTVVSGTVDPWWAVAAVSTTDSWVGFTTIGAGRLGGTMPIEITLNPDRTIAETSLDFAGGTYTFTGGPPPPDYDLKTLHAVRFRAAFTDYGETVRIEPPAADVDCVKNRDACPKFPFPESTTSPYTPPPFPG